MLLNMHINNIVLIDDIDICFGDNLNIMTGETGAGKSIIIGSLGICLGGKFSKELLRNDEKDGIVELSFLIDNDNIKKQLEDIEIYPDENNELIIARRLNQAGRTINRINDNTVTTAKLKEAAQILINLHAQHEQQTLLKASKHLEIVDRYGKEKIQAQKETVKALYEAYTDIKKQIEENQIDEAEKNKQLDFLKYQINEIESAKLISGEDDELEAFYKKALNSKDILGTADDIYKSTGYGNNCVSDVVGRALGDLKRLTTVDADLEPICNTLLDIDSMLSDFNRELSDYISTMEFDPEEFNQVEERLNLINSLKLKYGNSILSINDSLEEFKEKFNKLNEYDSYIKKLNDELEATRKELIKECDKLTEIRKQAADKLSLLIKQALENLNFATVQFEMEFKKSDKLTANGNDEAYFVISTNVGEAVRPLYDVASGGELSRVMLAIKSCIANEDDTPTLVFDEIDVGISGKTAQSVAKQLSVIGRTHQVICITHLPQIASMADSHYMIEKTVENNKTITNIRKLDENQEIEEISRLIGGEAITEATIANAKEMKDLANKTKLY